MDCIAKASHKGDELRNHEHYLTKPGNHYATFFSVIHANRIFTRFFIRPAIATAHRGQTRNNDHDHPRSARYQRQDLRRHSIHIRYGRIQVRFLQRDCKND